VRVNAVLQPDDSARCEFSPPPHGRARYPIRNPVSPASQAGSGQPCLALAEAAGAFSRDRRDRPSTIITNNFFDDPAKLHKNPGMKHKFHLRRKKIYYLPLFAGVLAHS
jgi:hypothetical protein